MKDGSVPRDGEATATASEIVAVCRQNLAPYKVPAVIRFVADLNLSATGKLVRHGGS
jgi:acyl-CoA synthetase (AMP-forming)/AMP-acid ligase II